MHALVLIGCDLVVSALLILAAMYAVWVRVRTDLETGGTRETGCTAATPAEKPDEPASPPAAFSRETWAFGAMTQKAATLRQEGCSTEAIAQRLQMPTREVEMVLAISEMGGVRRGDRAASMAFPRKPAAVLSA